MRKILRITPHKRNKLLVVIEFDDGSTAELHGESVAKKRLKPDTVLEDAAWEQVQRDDQRERCRQQAWKLLSIRLRSRKELEQGLRQRKYPAGIIEPILEELATKGFLDDAAFAKQFAQERTARRHGPRLVEQELKARGITREAAQRSVESASDATRQRIDARALLEKWNRRSKPEDPRKRAQAAAAFLMRRGYESEIVWDIVRTFFSAPEE